MKTLQDKNYTSISFVNDITSYLLMIVIGSATVPAYLIRDLID